MDRAGLSSVQGEITAEGLEIDIVKCHQASGIILPKAGQGTVYDIGPDLLLMAVVNSQTLHDSGTEVFNHHIRPLQKTEVCFPACFALQVQGQALFIAVQR